MENAMQTAQRAIVEALGFEQWQTGGGCMAYTREFAGGVHVMVTNGDCDLPDGTNWYVGVYDKNADPLEHTTQGEALPHYVAAVNEAIAFAEKSIPSTDDLADEYSAFLAKHRLPDTDADDLLCRIGSWKAWLEDFTKRWNEVQAHEDFEAAIAARGEA